MKRSSYDELVRAAYTGAFETKPWGRFLALLREDFTASLANIVLVRGDRRRPQQNFWIYDCETDGNKIARIFYDNFADQDPIDYYALEPLKVYSYHDLMDEAGRDRSYYREYLVPNGMRHSLMMRLQTDGGRPAWLTCARGDSRSFAKHERADLERVGNHLSEALSHFDSLALLELDSLAVTSERGARTTVVLDRDLRVIRESGHLLRRAGDAGLLQVTRNGKLIGATKHIQAALDDATDAVLSGAKSEVQMPLDSTESVFQISIQRAGVSEKSVRLYPALLLTILMRGPALLNESKVERLLGLSRREARLAVLIAAGHSIGQTATMMGVSVETARTYSKRVYAKLGIGGKADLVREVMLVAADSSSNISDQLPDAPPV